MTDAQSEWATAAGVWADCRSRWRALLATAVAYRVAAALLLGPLYALLLRLAVAGSGQPVLTDQDLLYFVTSPLGLLGLVTVGVAAVAIVALEVTALLAVLSQRPRHTSLVGAAGFTFRRSGVVLRVVTRLILHALAWAAPAALVAAYVYTNWLSRFDINYYLTQRPPVFWMALAVAAGLAVYLLAVAAWLVVAWWVALPLVLFEAVDPARAYRVSQERTAHAAWSIRGWAAGWAVGSLALSSAVTAVVSLVVWLIAPHWPASMGAVAAGVGLALLVLSVANALVSLASVVAFAALLRRLYLRLGGRAPRSQDDATDVATALRPWLTKPRMIALAAVGLLAAVTVGFVALASVPIEDQVVVIGHRGAPRAAPENSLSSVRAAIEAGADWVEIDVQETADGEVVVFHDSDFMKAAGVDLKIWDATLDDLTAIDIGSRYDASFSAERVPTLADTLEACRDKAGLLIELKYYGHNVALEQRVVDLVEAAGMQGQTMFMSLDKRGVERLKALRPGWKVGQLLSVAVGDQHRLAADFLAINAKAAKRQLIRATHAAGRDLYVWTVDDPATMSSLIARGVDGLITDTPGVARAVLRQRAEMTPVARLLVAIADRFHLALGTEPTATPPVDASRL